MDGGDEIKNKTNLGIDSGMMDQTYRLLVHTANIVLIHTSSIVLTQTASIVLIHTANILLIHPASIVLIHTANIVLTHTMRASPSISSSSTAAIFLLRESPSAMFFLRERPHYWFFPGVVETGRLMGKYLCYDCEWQQTNKEIMEPTS